MDFSELLSSKERLDSIVDYAYSVGHVQQSAVRRTAVCFAPFTILPSPVPSKVSFDSDFINSTLKRVVETDEFTKNLLKIYNSCEGHKKPCLGLFRSDYLLHEENESVVGYKQVEMNTIASSFGGLSETAAKIHEFTSELLPDGKLPFLPTDNSPTVHMAKAIDLAWQLYGSPEAVVLFIVQEKETNRFDQRLIEWKLKAAVLRRSFRQLAAAAAMLVDDGRLFVEGRQVAVVYFRAGYSPADYDQDAWRVRQEMERSSAIKCPTVGLQLAGTKKVQQKLSERNVLERLLSSSENVEQLRSTFMRQYGLDQELADSVRSEVLQRPDNWILKPQREGGGNNLFGDEILPYLQSAEASAETSAQAKQYVLMEKIRPPVRRNCLVRSTQCQQENDTFEATVEDCVSELGVYGAIVCAGAGRDDLLLNETSGHLLRTKPAGSDEGGVAAGFAVIDSISIVD